MGFTSKLVYLDNAASTYLDEDVRLAMTPFENEVYANPSSTHFLGRQASSALIDARQKIAGLLNAKSTEIIFTAGGTESINLALIGISGVSKTSSNFVTQETEHHAVLNSFKAIENQGHSVTLLPVDSKGFIDLNGLEKAILPETRLVSIMYANNEIGTVQPIQKISRVIAKVNLERKNAGLNPVLFHSDACQAAGYLEVDVSRLGVDLLTVNASKIYGPKQVALLYVREGVVLKPLIYGGGQERNLRSGTENLCGIVGFATALEKTQKNRASEGIRVQKLRDELWDGIIRLIPDVRLNGPENTLSGLLFRSPNNLNVSFKNLDASILLAYLDSKGVCASSASACSSNVSEASHVLKAIACPEDYIRGSIRFSLGKRTSSEEIAYVVKELAEGVKQIRQATAITSSLQKIKGSQASSNCISMQ